MPESLITLWNVLLVLLGFGFVIFWHELGHFLTARWAKIRVLEFAVGFGPAILAYRKGIGFRRGTTNPEYEELQKKHRFETGEDMGTVVTETGRLDLDKVPGVSQTEYRLNWVPLGGYVRMLGQEDANPTATSSAPDSYTQVPIWKRMIVVSGGVIMNVILAAVLFVVVYSVGLQSNAPVIQVPADSPAAKAGLETGDIVRSVNGQKVEVFQDLLLKIGLSKKGAPLTVEVERPGQGLLRFEVEPEYNETAQIRAIGVYALPGAAIVTPDNADRDTLGRLLTAYGLENVEPGMVLTSVNGVPIEPATVDPWGTVLLPTALLDAANASDGVPFEITFVDPADDRTVSERFQPRPEFSFTVADLGDAGSLAVEHLLGLTPPLKVTQTSEAGRKAGLLEGDVFVRLGDVQWPNSAEGVGVIRAAAGGTVRATVLRDSDLVVLELPVSEAGTVGFSPGGAFDAPYLASTPEPASTGDDAPEDWRRTGALGDDLAGMRLTSVGFSPVGSLFDARSALIDQTMDAFNAEAGAAVELTLASSNADEAMRTVRWELDAEAVKHLHTLGWTGDGALAFFGPATVIQVGENPVHSVRLGLRETQRMLTRVYLTLGRLADGSVKPEQLKGPVGITHIGSRVAREGVIRLLFFIGLISANLAVLNFLPLPIVDGGLFLMLCYEGITKKPVPVGVQNALTIVGLVVIAGVFLFVTTNDVLNLFG